MVGKLFTGVAATMWRDVNLFQFIAVASIKQ